VLAGDEAHVFRHIPGDPHPICFVRVLLGVEMCRQFYGSGPWDDLAAAWLGQYRIERAAPDVAELLRHSMPLLTRIAEITLRTPMKAFSGRSLSSVISPERVNPEALQYMERQLGRTLFTSSHWIRTESLRILALMGFKLATQPDCALDTLKQQDDWMFRLGGTLQAA
jgi:hypothetical protein